MRTLPTALLLALAAAAHAQPPIAATTIKMTVSSPDEDSIRAVAKAFAQQGARIELANATTVSDTAAARTTYSVTATRTGAFTAEQVQAAAAQCADYAARPNMRCSSEVTARQR